MELNETQSKIIDAVIIEYNKKGLKFTMDDIAKELHMSKKTIYREYADKEELFSQMVDYCFDSIKEKEKQVIEDDSLEFNEKLSKLLIALPDKLVNVDFSNLFSVKEKYPKLYHKVEGRLENNWEDTIALIEQGKKEGKLRKDFNTDVFKAIVEASFEKFLSSDVLVNSGLDYDSALVEMVKILMAGIMNDKEKAKIKK